MRTLFTLFFVTALSLCYAQNKPVEFSLNWKGGGNASSVRVNSVSGEANDIHAVIVNNKEHVKVLWFDSKMQVLKESQASSLNGRIWPVDLLKTDLEQSNAV